MLFEYAGFIFLCSYAFDATSIFGVDQIDFMIFKTVTKTSTAVLDGSIHPKGKHAT